MEDHSEVFLRLSKKTFIHKKIVNKYSYTVHFSQQGCNFCRVPSVQLMLIGRPIFLHVEEPEKVTDLVRVLHFYPDYILAIFQSATEEKEKKEKKHGSPKG
jgi:hypothetical protein